MKEFGLNVHIQEVEKDRPNVIGSLKGKKGGPTLLIEGHTDTVGLGDKKKWTVDPSEEILRITVFMEEAVWI